MLLVLVGLFINLPIVTDHDLVTGDVLGISQEACKILKLTYSSGD